jgi:uncharacterized protein YecE (DUF72 family)
MPFEMERLREALLEFGDPSRVAAEFRAECRRDEPVRLLLEELGVVFVNVDSPDEHPAGWVTGERACIRLHGRDHIYGYNYRSRAALGEIAELARRLGGVG